MRGELPLVALLAAALLLGAPGAMACGESGPQPRCPMARSAAMAEPMAGAMAAGGCHGEQQMPDDCCDLRSAPDPSPVPAAAGDRPVADAGTPALQPARPGMPGLAPPRHLPREVARPPEIGRYALFSAYLL